MVGKCKRFVFGLLACMMVIANVFFFASAAECAEVYAMEDDFVGNDGFRGSISEDDKGVGDWIKNRRGMTTEQLETAGRTLTPITNMVGYFVGGCIVVVFAGVFVITGLDLIYITIPPVRNILYKGGAQQGGGMMGEGYGGGRFGGGRFGRIGGMGGGEVQEASIQWISDEAVYCASLLGAGQQSQGGGGMMGDMGMIGGGGQQSMPMKSVISMYFKKRIFFMILLAVCVIVLTSSVLLGTGVNLAQWFLKLIDMVNGYVPQ